MNVLAECGGNRLQRFIRFLFKKKGTFSEWQTSECAVFWVESCVSGTNRDVDVDVQVNVCLSEAEAAPLPALLPDGAFIFHRFLDEKLYNGGCRSWRLITESYADFSLAAAPSRRVAQLLLYSWAGHPQITDPASTFPFTFSFTFIN